MEESFNELKRRLSNEVCLYLPNYMKKSYIRNRCLRYRIRSMLVTRRRQWKDGTYKMGSRKLTKTERNYAITEKELLAVVWGVEYFDYQLKEKKFSIITNHIA